MLSTLRPDLFACDLTLKKRRGQLSTNEATVQQVCSPRQARAWGSAGRGGVQTSEQTITRLQQDNAVLRSKVPGAEHGVAGTSTISPFFNTTTIPVYPTQVNALI